MDEIFRNICAKEKYYNPAHNHYGVACDVICDKCFRHNLSVSIGWKQLDLSCADSVIASSRRS